MFYFLFPLSYALTFMICNALNSCRVLQDRRAEMVRQNKGRLSSEGDEQQTASSG
jgi:hypothetical protein